MSLFIDIQLAARLLCTFHPLALNLSVVDLNLR